MSEIKLRGAKVKEFEVDVVETNGDRRYRIPVDSGVFFYTEEEIHNSDRYYFSVYRDKIFKMGNVAYYSCTHCHTEPFYDRKTKEWYCPYCDSQ